MVDRSPPRLTADLSGHTVLVTGGASGIGLATVRLFASMGATVAMNHLPDDERAGPAIKALRNEGYRIVDAPADISGREAAGAMVKEAVDELGHLDWLVSNAGVSLVKDPLPFCELDALTDDFWQGIMSVNLLGAFYCARAAAAALRESKGAIVNVSSSSHDGKSGTSIPYGVSKGALTSMTRSMAKALAPEVRVNSIAPGFVETPMTAARGPEYRERAKGIRLLKRVAPPEEIAQVILFLCVGATFITGEQIAVDGGRGY